MSHRARHRRPGWPRRRPRGAPLPGQSATRVDIGRVRVSAATHRTPARPDPGPLAAESPCFQPRRRSAESIAAEGISGENLIHHPHLHQSQIMSALNEADLLFLPLAFESPIQEVLRLASPGKMGDYLAMSKPILVHAPADSFVCQYFRQHDCGIVVDQVDVSLLAQTISGIVSGKISIEGLGERARQRAEIDFTIEGSQKRFMDLMQKVCQPSS